MEETSLISLPNPHLRRPSQKVGIVTDDTRALVQHMQDVTLEWEQGREHEVGVALAAIQIDIALRVIVIRNDFDNKDDRHFRAFINPVITKYEGELLEDYEGCLSVPDLYGKVPRYNKVRIKALDLDGKPVRFSAEGFLARVFQHEIDHTNGKVFIDHIKDAKQAFYVLDAEGNLQQLDYDQDVADNQDLWGE
jgi:peptide deformylase